MPSITPSDNDPIIDVMLTYPDEIEVPTGGMNSTKAYSGTVTLTDTSKLPLAASHIVVSVDIEDLAGYQVYLLDGDRPVPSIVLSTGALAAGASVPKTLNFAIKQIFPNPPVSGGNPRIIFHLMPSYQISYTPRSGDFSSECNLDVNSEYSEPGAVSAWTASPPWHTEPSNPDPIVSISQQFWKNFMVPLDAWNGGAWVEADIEVTNNAKVPLTSLVLQIEVEDTLSRYNLLCSVTQEWKSWLISNDLGPVAPGKTARYRFWQTVSQTPNTDKANEKGTGQLHVAPAYTVTYMHSDAMDATVGVQVS